jgi:aspartyl-tRNA(Asn)/glutamyl-tRNA(Gln) amidotransferase subunit C
MVSLSSIKVLKAYPHITLTRLFSAGRILFNIVFQEGCLVAEEITREIFDHLVDLAALALDEEEAEYLRAELNSQLQAIHELESMELDEGVEITSHGVPYTDATRPALRQDVIDPCKEADDILEQAAEVRDRYIVVPDIPAEELE